MPNLSVHRLKPDQMQIMNEFIADPRQALKAGTHSTEGHVNILFGCASTAICGRKRSLFQATNNTKNCPIHVENFEKGGNNLA